MATVAQFNQDPNNENQLQNAGGGGQVLNSTGGGGGGGSAGSGTYSAPRAPQSGAPNINQYLQANQGAGQQLAQGIQGNVQNQANQLGQQVNTYGNQLSSQYQPLQQNAQQSQQSIQTAFQNPQQLLDAYNASKSQSSNQPLSDQQQQSLDQYNQFQGNLAGTSQYNQEQQGIANYNAAAQQAGNNVQNQYANIQQQAGAANTEMGRFGLLQNAVGQPTYNTGQQTLDALFLQAQPGVVNQLQHNLGGIASQAGQNVQGLNNDVQSKLAALQGLSSQNQQQVQSLFGNELGNIGQNVQNEYNNLQQTAPAQQAAMQQAIQSNTFTPEQLKQLGLTQGQQTWGLSSQDIMNAGQFAANPVLAANAGGNAQAASPEEYARYNALNQLAGGPSGTMQASIFGGGPQTSYSPVSFNEQNLQNAINQRQQTLNGADFKNALTAILPSMGPPTGGQAANWDTQGGLRNSLSQGLQNGTLNPYQANQMINDFMNKQVANENPQFADVTRQQLNQMYSPFLNWYSQQYAPSATASIGEQGMQAPSAGGPAHTGIQTTPEQQAQWQQMLQGGYNPGASS